MGVNLSLVSEKLSEYFIRQIFIYVRMDSGKTLLSTRIFQPECFPFPKIFFNCCTSQGHLIVGYMEKFLTD